jgi:magnesium chelatase family protein
MTIAESGFPDEKTDMAHNDHGHSCFCSPEEIYRYWRKFSGALLDRVELRIAVLPPDINEMGRNSAQESSAEIARRVLAVAEIQRHRFKNTGIRRNALIPAGMMDAYCPLSSRAKVAFDTVMAKLGLSARAYHGILRVARTIADLDSREVIDSAHILEAIQHRRQGEDPFEVLSVSE